MKGTSDQVMDGIYASQIANCGVAYMGVGQGR